jgi:putative ABC transport system permease protein
MWSTTFKGIRGHTRRFLATCTAVVVGVAFLTATLVLGDTVKGGFAQLFRDANEGTAVVVRDATTIGDSEMGQRGLVDADVVEAVRGVEGVAVAVPVVEGMGQLFGADGAPLGGQGPPTVAGSWIDVPELNPYQLAEGRAPATTAPGEPLEVVIDRSAADDGKLAVGDRTKVQTPLPVEVVVVGIATFGANDSMAGTTYTGMTLEAASRVLANDHPGATQVRVAAADGVDPEELAARVAQVLPGDDEALTGAELSAEQLSDIEEDFLGMMTTLLLVFAGVALLVAAFSIHNTFAILAAQKARESALLRAIGATRRQVLGSVLLESLAVGVLATTAGLLVGIGLGGLLQALLDAADMGLPTGDLVVSGSALVAGAVVGLGVTLVASFAPALHASRVSPLSALRASAAEASTLSRGRTVVGVLTLAAGVALVASGTTGDGDLGRVGVGSLVAVVGFLVAGPLLARVSARVIGTPGRLLRGVTGQLAQENAVRNPRRTASTSTALVIGMAVVTLFTVFGASLAASIEDEVTSSFGDTDLVVEATSFAGSGIGTGFTEAVLDVPGVEQAAALSFVELRLDGRDEGATITEPAALAAVSDLGIRAGDLATLGDDRIAVSSTYAEEHGWTIGTPVDVAFADGATETATVAAVYTAKGALGDVIAPPGLWEPHATRPLATQVVLIGAAPGVAVDVLRTEVDALAEGYGSPTIRDREQYVDAVGSQVNQLLSVVYVLLGVAVVIALLGIANTLSLSIHERTRELGVLRAVGQSRRQTRSAIRWEAVVVSVFGTLAGLGLGVLVGWGLVRATSGDLSLSTVAVPPAQLAVLVVVGAVVGVLAAVRPARRAARIDVLQALATS